MAIKAVTVSVDVPDIDAGMHFFQHGLGFEPKNKISADVFELESQGVRLFLLKKAPGSQPVKNHPNLHRIYERHWAPVHLDIEVDDLKPALERALGAGATLESESSSPKWGSIALCADPFGNGFCLIQPAHV